MSLVSFNFLLFILAVVVLYYVCPVKFRKYVLIPANIAFCCFAGVYTLAFVMLSVITTFAGGLIAGRRSSSPAARRAAAVITIVFNFGLLCAVKFYGVMGLVSDSLNTLLGASSGSWLEFAVPLGMSFYTLQLIGYVLDCLWEKIEPEKNFIKYFLFGSYFPYLTSGPMNRYSDLSEEICRDHHLAAENFRNGTIRICWGFFKKLVIAERAGVIVNAVYGDHNIYTGWYVLLGVTAFAIQLYADFSGCMDVVIGVSKLLDINMPENFNSPYFARSIREYWRRWHITLGDYLADYLYYPLLKSALFVKIGDASKKAFGKKKGKKVPIYLAMVILWTAIGYWHGGVWKYIIGSGLLHCFYIVSGMMCEPIFEKIRPVLKSDKLPYQIFQVVRTFVLVLLGFVFFRAANVPDAIDMLKAIFMASAGEAAIDLTMANHIVLIASVLVLAAVDLFKFRPKDTDEPRSVITLTEGHPVFTWVIIVVLIAAVLVFGMYGLGYNASSFIYATI
ncbi:D-alanyl-lipoteichoic acid acyltransferase DltB, MBOAT superfamily [Ruminococcaceae bacterium YRB3002]|nr:D-alanyl-lipoteichoic acid acyltransferase DltB, MBOAT superfamily [Ruminococcaceae bacterium YRB3002]